MSPAIRPHVPAERHRSGARTRLVRVDALAAQRTWPDCHELLRRFAAYGDSHGAWADSHGYTEGSLARIVEAASAGSPVLPSVKQNPNFLCGDEFSSVAAELDFFAALGMSVQAVQVELTLEPGALMIFDNLALAHGRRGVRQPGELHQRVFGRRALPPSGQREMRDRVLAAFTGKPGAEPRRADSRSPDVAAAIVLRGSPDPLSACAWPLPG